MGRPADSGQQISHIVYRLEVLDQHLGLAVSPHAHLRHIDLWRLVWSKQNIVMGRILLTLELVRREMTAKMITAPRCDMQRTKHLFTLTNTTPNKDHLLSETCYS